MSDPIKYVKSSGGGVDSEFTGDDAVIRDLVDVLSVFDSYSGIVVSSIGALVQYQSQNWHLSDLIPVHGQCVYMSGKFELISDGSIYNKNVIFYDVNGNRIGGVDSSRTVYSNYRVELPEGTRYVRAQYFVSQSTTEETMPRLYASVDWASFADKKAADYDTFKSMISPEATSFLRRTGKNMLNPEASYPYGKYISYGAGVFSDGASGSRNTYLIPVQPGETYAMNKASQLVFFDQYSRFIGGISNTYDEAKTSGVVSESDVILNGGNPGTELVFKAPSNAYFVSATITDSYGDVQLEKGSAPTEFEPYTVGFNCNLIRGDEYGTRLVRDVVVPAVIGKKTIKLIGDSITAGVGGTGYDNTADGGGVLLWNNVYTNVQGTCWANMLKDYWEGKYGCTVLNYGYSGIASSHIIQYIDTLVEDTDDVVVCMIGTNDRNESQNSDLSGYIAKLQQIVNLVTSKGKDLILMANIPASVNNEANTPRVFHMEDVDNAVAYVASQNSMEYVSVYKLFIEYCNYTGTSIDSLLVDGLHPNDDGYEVMFELISNALGIATKRDGATW